MATCHAKSIFHVFPLIDVIVFIMTTFSINWTRNDPPFTMLQSIPREPVTPICISKPGHHWFRNCRCQGIIWTNIADCQLDLCKQISIKLNKNNIAREYTWKYVQHNGDHLVPVSMCQHKKNDLPCTGLDLGLRQANEWRRYKVTLSLIG